MVFCVTCDRSFNSYEAYRQHARDKKHEYKPYQCDTCDVGHATQDDLKGHYRTSDDHPSCARCPEAFKDQAQLTAHMTAIHYIKCNPCNLTFYREDIQLHFRESANHPTCVVCGDGFETDVLHQQHTTSAHTDTRCAPCNRLFRTKESLRDHYRDSPAHPHCAICGVGFENDEACDAHMTQNHPPRRVIASPPPSIRTQVEAIQDADTVLSVATTQLQSSQSPPLQPCDDNSISPDEPQSVLHQSTMSEYSHSSALRTVSEPALPSASSLVGGNFANHVPDNRPAPDVSPPSLTCVEQDEASIPGISCNTTPIMSQRSLEYTATGSIATHLTGNPTASPVSQGTLDFVSFPGLREESAPSESSMSTSSLHMSDLVSETKSPAFEEASPTPSVRPLPLYHNPSRVSLSLSEAHLRAASEVKEIVTARPEPLISSVLATPSHTVSGQDFGQINTSFSPLAQDPHSRPASTLPSPPLSPGSRRMSVTSAASVRRARSRLATLSDTDATVQNVPASTERAPSASRTPKGLSWHCRVCLKNPCTEPTATMCGHIFCHSCIIKEIATNMQCPVCKKSMLLRLHVETD